VTNGRTAEQKRRADYKAPKAEDGQAAELLKKVQRRMLAGLRCWTCWRT